MRFSLAFALSHLATRWSPPLPQAAYTFPPLFLGLVFSPPFSMHALFLVSSPVLFCHLYNTAHAALTHTFIHFYTFDLPHSPLFSFFVYNRWAGSVSSFEFFVAVSGEVRVWRFIRSYIHIHTLHVCLSPFEFVHSFAHCFLHCFLFRFLWASPHSPWSFNVPAGPFLVSLPRLRNLYIYNDGLPTHTPRVQENTKRIHNCRSEIFYKIISSASGRARLSFEPVQIIIAKCRGVLLFRRGGVKMSIMSYEPTQW
jgi:hypothetical protein